MTKKAIIPIIAIGTLTICFPAFAFTQEEKDIYSSAIDTAFDGHPEATFLQTDFNNDGIQELLIDYYPLSSYMEGTDIEVFTIVNGECVSAGSISIVPSTFYDAESGEGLYAVSGYQGVETKLELHMYNNELSYTEIKSQIKEYPKATDKKRIVFRLNNPKLTNQVNTIATRNEKHILFEIALNRLFKKMELTPIHELIINYIQIGGVL